MISAESVHLHKTVTFAMIEVILLRVYFVLPFHYREHGGLVNSLSDSGSCV